MVKTIRGWIVAFSQIDTGWESVCDRLHAHIEKQRLAETEIYILDPMTAQLTHETWLTSIALSTTSFPIIWCAGHLPAQNNDGHMFYQKLFLCINDGPVIVTGISLLYQRRAFYRDRHEQRRYPFPFHGMSPLFQRYTLVQVQSHISSDHLLILSIFLSSISSFSQIDTGWESV